MKQKDSSVFSFPYDYKTYRYGIRPNHVTQEQMNETIYKMYQDWRKIYLRTDGCPQPGMLRDWGGAISYKNGTCSEGTGYAMLISVYFANESNSGHEDFDALYKYYKYYTQVAHGANSEGLMAWLIDENGKAVSGIAATDGDLDVGFALVLASKKWGTGEFDYLEEAKHQINIMADKFLNQKTYALLSSDIETDTRVMAAYLMPAWFKTFYEITGDERWLKVIDFCYKSLQKFIDDNPSTGLAPYKYNIFTLERLSEKDTYSWDSCRTPWRIGTDYIWNGTCNSPLAYESPFINVKWFLQSTGGDPANHVEDYELDGTPIGSVQTPTIVGPMAVAAMTDESMQEFLNAMYDYLISIPMGLDNEAYFRDHVELLTLLVITGNHPNMWEM